MEVELFIDSIRALWHSLESGITQVLIGRKSLTVKLQLIAIELLSHKSLAFSKLQQLLTQTYKNNQSKRLTINSLQIQIQQCQHKLLKLKLHTLLREKIKKMRKDSLKKNEDDKIYQLNNSMMMLEKELGINDQEDSIISDVVQRSMLSLQCSSFVKIADQSMSQSNFSMEISSPKEENYNKFAESVLQMSDLKTQNEPIKIQKKQAKKPPLSSNTNRMKKKLSKGQFLGNLLEQSYQNCTSNEGN